MALLTGLSVFISFFPNSFSFNEKKYEMIELDELLELTIGGHWFKLFWACTGQPGIVLGFPLN